MIESVPVETFLRKAKGYGYKVFGEEYHGALNLNIVGWRFRPYYPNAFNDTLSLYHLQANGRWAEHHYGITTLPGVPFLRNPINRKGAAVLAPGQYRAAYALGKFKGYKALKQVGNLTIYRDNDRDGKFDLSPSSVEKGLFGIHIHKAGLRTKIVGNSSAGCQVFKYAQQYEDFIDLCRRSANLWGNSFTYTLMEI